MDIRAEVNRALDYTKQKEFKKAEKIYLEILKVDSQNAVVLSFLGLLYMNVGHFGKSKKCLLKADSIKSNPATTEGLGLVNYFLNRYKDAEGYFEKIINNSKSFDVYDKYTHCLLKSKQFSKAYKYSEKFYQLYPLAKESACRLANSCIHIGKFEDAYRYSLNLTTRFPKYAEGWQTLGLVYEIYFHDEEESNKCFQKVLRLGNKFSGYYNLSVNSYKIGNYKKSLYYINKLKKADPDSTTADFTLAIIYMKQCKYKKGLKYYSKYIHESYKKDPDDDLNRLKNIWDGKTYKDETLLVYADQGVGDNIMFSRYMPFLEKKFKQIKVLLYEPLFDLFKYAFRDYKKIKFYKKGGKFPQYDKSAILSCLAAYLKMDYGNIPFSDKYFDVEQKYIDKYSKIITTDKKLKVGICWEAGAAGLREQLNRTLNVSMFEPFLNIKSVQFYSLQVNPAMDNYKDYPQIIDLGKDFKDYSDTAGAIRNLDLVVTVDTSVAHLAGALGVKTFMLLPYCTDWRWFDDKVKTPWYNSVKLFKQTDPKDWDSIIEKVTEELKNEQA